MRASSRKMKAVAALVAALSLTAAAGGAGGAGRPYPCFSLQQAPAWGDGAWDTLPSAGGFSALGGGYAPMENQTLFRMGWTKDSLCVKIRCADAAAKEVQTRGNGSFWEEDSIELFFAVPGTPNLNHLAVNANGARWMNGTVEGKAAGNWKAHTTAGMKAWELELQIPLFLLGRTPKPGEEWRFNITRNRKPPNEYIDRTCWAPQAKNFGETETFGSLVFNGRMPAAGERLPLEAEINRDYIQHMTGAINGLHGKYAAYKENLAGAVNDPALRPEALSLKQKWEWVESAQGQDGIGFMALAAGFAPCEDLDKRTSDLTTRYKMKTLFEQ